MLACLRMGACFYRCGCHNRLGALFLVWIAAIGDVSSLLRAATIKDTMVSTFVDLAQKVISLFRV